MKLPIYLDNHATTPVDPRVFDVMAPFFTERYGNASSRSHSFGWDAEAAVENARLQIADAIGASPKEIVFTSGATESNNLAIKGIAEANRNRGNHIITVVTEHKAVLDACQALERKGFEVTYLDVDPSGVISVDTLSQAISDNTILVSVMHANNEIGVLQPIAEIGALCRAKGVFFHTDAAQSVGKVPINVNEMSIDLLSMSAHKVYGPKGIGALYVRRQRPGIRLTAQMDGGGHERGYRSGTLAVPLIVGLGEAVELAVQDIESESKRLLSLRDRLWKHLNDALTEITVNGHYDERLPGNLNVSVAFVEGEALLMSLEDIALSSGSACTSDSLEASYVLKALGVRDDLAHSSLRFGVGRFTTAEEIDYTARKVVEVVHRLRELSPLWQMVLNGKDPNAVKWTPT